MQARSESLIAHQSEKSPPEGQLRYAVLQRLTLLAADVPKQTVLVRLFREYVPNATGPQVLKLIYESVSSAKRAMKWEGADEADRRVGIGYFQRPEDYFTTLLHEVGHNVLRKLGRSRQDYEKDLDGEEDFCWRFSQLMCHMLGLAYSAPTERLYRDFWQVKSALVAAGCESPVLLSQLESLFDREREEIGFSLHSDEGFIWNEEGRPILAPLSA